MFRQLRIAAIFLLALSVGAANVHAQGSFFVRSRTGAVDPATCDPNANEGLFYNTIVKRFKVCTALNTWSALATAAGNVSSFNSRIGAIVLSGSDVRTALGFTPENQLTFSAPFSRIGNSIFLPQANASVDGFLSAVNWSTFNNKQDPIGFTPERQLTFSAPFSRVGNTISFSFTPLNASSNFSDVGNPATARANIGAGTVTSVSMTTPGAIFNTPVTVTNPTTTPQIQLSLLNQTPNKVLAAPASGAAAPPTFRALVAADLPSLSSLYVDLTSGQTIVGAKAFSTSLTAGQSAPGSNPLNVAGGATIGAGYTSTIAPTNGLAVQGATALNRTTVGSLGHGVLNVSGTSLSMDDTSNYDFVFLSSTGTADININLPNEATNVGRVITFKRTYNNTASVTVYSNNYNGTGVKIDEAGTYFLTFTGYLKYVTLVSDGVGWRVVGKN